MATASGTAPDTSTDVRDAAAASAGHGDLLQRWVDALAAIYPPADAEEWDQVGLHVGDPVGDLVTGVLVSLDVTPAVLDEARQRHADLVIAHHPLLFTPLRRLTPHTPPGRLALRAARQGCGVLVAHTNLDQAAQNTSHPAAAVLDLTSLRPVRPLSTDRTTGAVETGTVKIVTFVPRADTDAVVTAMAAAGAGQIGDYSECAFTTPGTGRFRPGPGADPHIGTHGRRQDVPEDRVEMVMRRGDIAAVVANLIAAHPYEEVPYDLYPLVTAPGEPSPKGLGLIGDLPQPVSLRAVADRLAHGLPAPGLRLAADDPSREVRTVAVCGGAGADLIDDLVPAGGPPLAEVFVTGDLRHHRALDALAMGLALIDAGHFATENPAMDTVVAALDGQREPFGLTAPIMRSAVLTDPWTAHPTTTRRDQDP